MSSKAIAFVITVLFASLASGQTPADQERVFLPSTASVQDVQQMAALIRAITDIPQVSTDAVRKSIAVHGTAQQIALAEWLLSELERPAGAQPSAAAREYRLPGEHEGVVRVFYMTQAKTVPELQEGAILLRMMTGIGSMTGIRRMYTYNAAKAVAARGTADQIATAEWLYEALSRPAGAQAAPERRVAGSGDELLRVLYLTHAETVQDFQEVATLIRSLADIRGVCTYSAGKAVSVRGSASQVVLAAWLLNELDRLAGAQSSAAVAEYLVSGENEGEVRVFHVTQAKTVQELDNAAILLREKTGIRRMYSYYRARAVAVRGTADQVAAAKILIDEPFVADSMPATGKWAGSDAPRNLSFSEGEPGKVPAGWMVGAGQAELQRQGCHSSSACVAVWRPASSTAPFGNLMQHINAVPYRGKTVRLSGWLRMEPDNANDIARLWFRVDRSNGRIGFFDNMDDRAVKPSGWTHAEIVGNIASDADVIRIGVLSKDKGKAWVDGLTFEIVPGSTPLTGYMANLRP